MTDPFEIYMNLQGSWDDTRAQSAHDITRSKENQRLARQAMENSLRYERFLRLNPKIEFRISDDGFSRPRFSPGERTYTPIKRISPFLHITLTLPIHPPAPEENALETEILCLPEEFQFLADNESLAKNLVQCLSDILPGTSVSSPNWPLDLDYLLSIDQTDTENRLRHKTPEKHLRSCLLPAKNDFTLALGAAQEACRILMHPDFDAWKNPLGPVPEDTLARCSSTFKQKALSTDAHEHRRRIMIQNALMCHIHHLHDMKAAHIVNAVLQRLMISN